jgi:hypothetical protein
MNEAKLRQVAIHKRLVDGFRKRYSSPQTILYQNYRNTELIDLFPGDENANIMDCGCGNGILLNRFENEISECLRGRPFFQHVGHM